MNRNRLALVITGILLIGVLGLCALTAFSSYRWYQAQNLPVLFFYFADVSAEVSETRQFSISTPMELEVQTDSGEITVIAGEGDQVEVEIIRKAWGENEAQARAAAEALAVEVEQTGNKLKLVFRQSDRYLVFGSLGGEDRVSFIVHAPVETAVQLTSFRGNISLTGTHGAAEVSGWLGDTEVTGLEGRLTLNRSNGNLAVRGLSAPGEPVELSGGFGDVLVENMNALSLAIYTGNGNLTLREVITEGEAIIHNQFGTIEIENLSASRLEVENNNGPIALKDCQLTGLLQVTNLFGDVRMQGVTGEIYRIKTNNGLLEVEGAAGKLELENDFGDIQVTQASQAILDIKTTNGRIEFSGSLDENSTHSLQNNFGNIILSIPPESALDLRLKTEMGRITSDLPVSFSGELDNKSWQGTLNGGGALLSAQTTNGDILLKILP